MDPFSLTAGSLQIVAACAACTVTIIKWVGNVRTCDERIAGFYEEVLSLKSTYEGLDRSLSSPLMAEAARVANKSQDGAHLWRQIRFTLDDSAKTIDRVNKVLADIDRQSGFGRRVKMQLQESLKAGELSRLRQRIQFFNATLSLPIQMVCVMLQLEQRGMSTDHQRQLDAKLVSLERSMRELVNQLNRPSRTFSFGSATLVAGEAGEIDDYVDFACKFLSSASAAASTRSTMSTVTPQMEPPPPLKIKSDSSSRENKSNDRKTIVENWIPPPMGAMDKSFDPGFQQQPITSPSNSNNAKLQIDFKLTQNHLKLAQEKAEQGNFESAEKSFRRALVLLEAHDFSGRIAFQPAEVVLMLAQTCLKQDNYDEAIVLLTPVAEKEEDIFPKTSKPAAAKTKTRSVTEPPDSLQALAASHMLGEVYLQKGDFDEAETHSLTAFTERTAELGSEDEKTLESVRLLIKVYEAKGDDEEAEAYKGFLDPTVPQSIDTVIDSRQSVVSVDDHETLSDDKPYVQHHEPQSPPSKPKNRKFTARLRNTLTRSSQSQLEPPLSSSSDTHRLSFSRSTTVNEATPEVELMANRLENLRTISSPSDSSICITPSINDDTSSFSMPTKLEKRSSTQTIEPTFMAIESLCSENKYDKAVKLSIDFLKTYNTGYLIVRKEDIEKNIRKGSGKGLASSGRGYAPIHFFTQLNEEHPEEIHLLIKRGVDINAIAYKAGYTPANPMDPFTALQLATERNHTNITKLLLECPGIQTNLPDSDGFSPLLLGCRKSHYTIVRQLLDHHATHQIPFPTTFPRGWYGTTLLHDAARRCDPVLVDLLLERGVCGIDAQDKFGKTALMHAIIKNDIADLAERRKRTIGRRRVVKALINAGADLTVCDSSREHFTAVDYARKEADDDLLRLVTPTLELEA